MLFSLPRKRGINIAKIRGNKVTDYTIKPIRWTKSESESESESEKGLEVFSMGSFYVVS